MQNKMLTFGTRLGKWMYRWARKSKRERPVTASWSAERSKDKFTIFNVSINLWKLVDRLSAENKIVLFEEDSAVCVCLCECAKDVRRCIRLRLLMFCVCISQTQTLTLTFSPSFWFPCAEHTDLQMSGMWASNSWLKAANGEQGNEDTTRGMDKKKEKRKKKKENSAVK